MPLVDTRLSRFLLVGVSNTIVSYLVFIFAYHVIFPGNVFLSQPISYAAGIGWSYIWNRRWTFESINKVTHEFQRFVVVQITLLLASTGALHVAVDLGNMNATVGWILVMSLVTLANFVITRHFVFR